MDNIKEQVRFSEKYKYIDEQNNSVSNNNVSANGNGIALNNNNNHNGNTQMTLQEIIEREVFIKIYVGETGVGKSYGINEECKAYARDNQKTGKKARPVFLFDPNYLPNVNTDYTRAFPRKIIKEDIGNIINPELCLVMPINPDGTFMGDEEKRNACIFLANNCRNCLLVLDDLDNYFKGEKPREMDKMFVSYRHRGTDIILVHQFLNPITTQEWGAVRIISLRKTVHKIRTIADRVPNPEVLYIAELMVEEQYDLAQSFKNKLSPSEYKIRQSFFVDVDIRKNKIMGAYSKQCFVRNCRKYLNLNSGIINAFHKMNCDRNGKPLYNREQAIQSIIQRQLWRYFAGREF